MASSSTRLEIVQRAVKQVGRSAELYSHGKELLNDLLRGAALANRYKVLRKFGSTQTLSIGSQTVSLPSDFGVGTESLVFSDTSVPISEVDLDDFVEGGGIPAYGTSGGRPTNFMTDKEAGVWRFNRAADRAYSFTPIYYKLPEAYALDSTDDNTQIWYEDDQAIIEGLKWKLFAYTDDVREVNQYRLWEQLDAQYRRGTQVIHGGMARVRLSPARFRTRG